MQNFLNVKPLRGQKCTISQLFDISKQWVVLNVLKCIVGVVWDNIVKVMNQFQSEYYYSTYACSQYNLVIYFWHKGRPITNWDCPANPIKIPLQRLPTQKQHSTRSNKNSKEINKIVFVSGVRRNIHLIKPAHILKWNVRLHLFSESWLGTLWLSRRGGTDQSLSFSQAEIWWCKRIPAASVLIVAF